MSRDGEVAAVTAELEALLDELRGNVAALTGILGNSEQEGEPCPSSQ